MPCPLSFWVLGGSARKGEEIRPDTQSTSAYILVCQHTRTTTTSFIFTAIKRFSLNRTPSVRNIAEQKQKAETPNFSFKTFLSPRKQVQIFTAFLINISWNGVFKITLTRDFSHIFYWRQTWICTSLLLLKWPIQITQKPSLASSSHNKE